MAKRPTRNITVTDFAALHAAVESLGRQVVIFRGQRSTSWALTPKVGRSELFSRRDREVEELNLLKLFKERAVPHLNFAPANDWSGLR